jgi:hypothetical protein
MTALNANAQCIHHVPGRLRVHVPGIRRNAKQPLVCSRVARRGRGEIPAHETPFCRVAISSAAVRKHPRLPTCGRPQQQNSVSSTLTRKVGPWLLGKSVEFAIEKSVLYALAALL